MHYEINIHRATVKKVIQVFSIKLYNKNSQEIVKGKILRYLTGISNK